MENKKHIIYYIVILLNVICLSLTIYYMFPNIIRVFSFLTLISLTLDTIYLAGLIRFERQGDHSSQSYRKFMDVFFKYTFILSFTVFISFWALLAAGPTFVKVADNPIAWSICIWTHFGVNWVIFADVFISDHQKEKNFKRDMIVSLTLTIIYITWIIVAVKKFDFKIYPFLYYLTTTHCILILFSIYLVAVIGYNVYKKMLKIKTKRHQMIMEGFVTIS